MTAVGTPLYIAPEIWKRTQYDESVDMCVGGRRVRCCAPNHSRPPTPPTLSRRYAFGLVLYEMITGVVPLVDDYRRLGRSDFIRELDKGLRSLIPPRTHRALAETLRKCWHLNPSERESPSAIIVRLEGVFEERSASPPRPSPPSPLSPSASAEPR